MIISKLANYFQDKPIGSQADYEKDKDAPVRLIAVRRYLGPWSRVVTKVERAIEKANRIAPIVEEIKEDVEEIVETIEEKPTIIPPKPVAKKVDDAKK